MRIGTKRRCLFGLTQGLMCLIVADSSTARQIKMQGGVSQGSTKVATDAEERTARDGWVPPDIDAVRLPIAKGGGCALQDVTSKAGIRVEEFTENLNRLTATETIRTQTVSHSGALHHPEIQKAEYTVSANRKPDGNVRLEEYRGHSMSNISEPPSDHVAVVNAFSLLLIFHPYHAKDFQMNCEGLGNWHGQPAWQIRFEERSGHMSALEINGKDYPLRLRGRAWILVDSYQVARVETDLIETIPEISLRLQHQIIEYSRGEFRDTNVMIWLPLSAELYMDFRGHRFYRRHSYSDFRLFSVKVHQEFGEIR